MSCSRSSAFCTVLLSLAALAACEQAVAPGGGTTDLPPDAAAAGKNDAARTDARTNGSGGAGGEAGASGGAGGSHPGEADASVTVDSSSGTSEPRSDAGAGAEAGSSPSGDVVPSAACAGGAVMPGPNGVQMIQANGKNRTFIIRMPTGYDGKKALPVMVAFHGAGGGASAFEGGAFGGVSRMAADKAVRMFPQALGNTWSRDENDDVLYMDEVMKWLSQKVCYDTARVFATGQSSGAYFSHRWACDRGGVLVRAVATNSGGQRKERALDCKTPVSSWTSTGRADNPGHVMGTRQARDVWAKLAGCSMNTMATTPAPCMAFTGCRAGLAVHHCEHGGGHAFPSYGPEGVINFFFGPNKP